MKAFRAFILLATASFVMPSLAALEDGYFAPENQLIFRYVAADGKVREFERDFEHPGQLRSLGRWDGTVDDEGVVTILRHDKEKIVEGYRFTRGRMTESLRGKKHLHYPYERDCQPPKLPYSPLAIVEYENLAEVASEHSRREMAGKWKGSGRFDFPYANPNQSAALYAELMLLFLFCVSFRSLKIKIPALALAVACGVCMLWTQSRGAALSVAAGLSFVALVNWRRLIASRLFWAGVACAAVAAVAWFCYTGGGNLSRGLEVGNQDMSWSVRVRLDMWRTAPQMMADALGGWGWTGAGRAYLNWYQPELVYCLTGSLMNDHLTNLVNLGLFGRFVYVFTALLALALTADLAFRRRQTIPFACVAAYLMMAWFNPIMSEGPLWIVPSLAFLYGLFRFPWRNVRCVAGWMTLSLALAIGVLGTVQAVGAYQTAHAEGPRIYTQGRRVMVQSPKPRVWVVDDGRGALGGVLACKDIRSFYSSWSDAEGLGYVTDLADLPEMGVERLVLAGKAGMDWLLKISEDESTRKRLPKSVLFVSPPFLPSEIPEGVRALCCPEVLVGEFAARFSEEYQKPSLNVKVVPGMEKYILRWMSYALGYEE